MRRLRLFVLIAVGLVIFLLVSAVLARVLSVDGAERSAITSLIQAEASGNAASMTRQILDCAKKPDCQRRAAQDAAQLRRSGTVKILTLGSSAGFSLGSTLGTSRVAWRAGGALPVVQCVRVRRAGDALRGLHIELLEISLRINSQANCPAHY